MQASQKGYRDLRVWQEAVDLVPKVYQLIKQLPKEEMYAMGDQLRRAVVSIPANIAEGQARQHKKEFLQHLSIAKGSLAETETLLVVAHRLGYIDQPALNQIESVITGVRRPLQGLMNRLR